MSQNGEAASTGNSEKDWEIFDVLCSEAMASHRHHSPVHHHTSHFLTTPDPHCHTEHMAHDLATTLRSELAASTYKRDRLAADISELKHVLRVKDGENDNLKAQLARQSALITSLQERLRASEVREKEMQTNSETNHHTFHREKKLFEEKTKDLTAKIRHLEHELQAQKTCTDDTKKHFDAYVRKLGHCIGLEATDAKHPTPECVVNKANELMAELHRLKHKLTATSETLNGCESEFHNFKSHASAERGKLVSQLETLEAHNESISNRCRALEKELHITKDRLTESEVTGDKLREELRGLESRCSRIQSNMDRLQSDRLQFLRQVASIINAPEPCETLIKDKLREITNHNQVLHTQLCAVREQLNTETTKHKEFHEAASHKIKAEETGRANAEDHLLKAQHEIDHLKAEHFTLSEYLVRMARALQWSECSSPPSPGHDTTILAETLLERGERLANFYDHHGHAECGQKLHAWDHPVHSAPHHTIHHLPKLRRERSCHDIPLKESANLYALQKRVRILREQVQRRDLHLELLRRKLALVEDGARGKAILQTERDEALHRARKNSRQAERTAQQLIDVKAQLAEVKAQLAEAADYKITALERARKIDDLQAHVGHLETEKHKLQTQLAHCKTRARSVSESSAEKRVRDEATIATLREEVAALKHEIEQLNHRLAHLKTFHHSVVRLIQLRDLPDSNIVHRIHALISAHDEVNVKKYDCVTSPIRDRGSDDMRQIDSPPLPRRYSDHFLDMHSHHAGHHSTHHLHDFDDDFKF